MKMIKEGKNKNTFLKRNNDLSVSNRRTEIREFSIRRINDNRIPKVIDKNERTNPYILVCTYIKILIEISTYF